MWKFVKNVATSDENWWIQMIPDNKPDEHRWQLIKPDENWWQLMKNRLKAWWTSKASVFMKCFNTALPIFVCGGLTTCFLPRSCHLGIFLLRWKSYECFFSCRMPYECFFSCRMPYECFFSCRMQMSVFFRLVGKINARRVLLVGFRVLGLGFRVYGLGFRV